MLEELEIGGIPPVSCSLFLFLSLQDEILNLFPTRPRLLFSVLSCIETPDLLSYIEGLSLGLSCIVSRCLVAFWAL